MAESTIHILLVEDNPGDVRLTTLALRGMRIPIQVSTTRDGEEALAFMRRDAPFSSVCPPDLVLLDLNMPKKNGFEVLMEMRDDPKLKLIPVLVLTSSDSEVDILRSYSLHANAYVVKPTGLNAYGAVVKAIEDFWLQMAQLPTRRRANAANGANGEMPM